MNASVLWDVVSPEKIKGRGVAFYLARNVISHRTRAFIV